MTDAQHTKGPWHLSVFGGEPSVTVVPDEHGYAPRIAYIDHCFVHFEGQNLRGEAGAKIEGDMRLANAKLMAAAPTILEALMDIAVLAEPGSKADKLASAAIAKARA